MEKKSDKSCHQANKSNDNLFLDDDVEDDDSDPANSDAESETLKPPKSTKRTLDDEAANEVRKKKMKREKSLFEQPTVEELNRLRETENLFHSNLFRLQIEEVIDAVKVKEKYKKLFGDWLTKFTGNILSIEETEEHSVSAFAKMFLCLIFCSH